MTQVKSYLAQAIKESSINVLEIDAELLRLSEALKERINTSLADYGLTMPEFYVSRVVTPDDDPNFRKMKEQYAEQYLLVRQEKIRQAEATAAAERKAVEAQTEARMKIIGAQGDAEALRIQRQAEADAYRMKAEAEAAEMRMKGYTYQQETSRQVGMEAMKNGISGGAAGALGDVAGMGVALGAMGGVINMTRDAMNPLMQDTAAAGAAAVSPDTWDCSCGAKGITGKFCPECGAKRPQPAADTWTCPECGQTGLTTKFCPECGTPRPAPKLPLTWDCPACGAKGNSGKFCSECGAKRPEPVPAAWDCTCGEKGITGKFCPNCGKKRE